MARIFFTSKLKEQVYESRYLLKRIGYLKSRQLYRSAFHQRTSKSSVVRCCPSSPSCTPTCNKCCTLVIFQRRATYAPVNRTSGIQVKATHLLLLQIIHSRLCTSKYQPLAIDLTGSCYSSRHCGATKNQVVEENSILNAKLVASCKVALTQNPDIQKSSCIMTVPGGTAQT
jgi:hypothetical protein